MCSKAVESEPAGLAVATSRTGRLATTVEGQLRAQIDSVGRKVVVNRIQTAGRRALAALPEDTDVSHLGKLPARYVANVEDVLTRAARASAWDDDQLARFVEELAGLKLTTDAMVSSLINNGGGGSTGATCATLCRREYDQCINDEGCDEDAWFCLCCAPCVAQYVGCMTRCVKGTTSDDWPVIE
jgi:hypothetical protein